MIGAGDGAEGQLRWVELALWASPTRLEDLFARTLS
jgi:hypothetical protein